jgi:hypothetical protein
MPKVNDYNNLNMEYLEFSFSATCPVIENEIRAADASYLQAQ